jgi:hypothetical protein
MLRDCDVRESKARDSAVEDTWEEIHQIGHRHFVGGVGDYWEKIGDLQLRYLVDRGLAPSDTLIDVGCGSLRGGAKFIRYLDPSRYLGIDKHIELIIYGVAMELGIDLFRQKRPRFVVSDSFDFARFGAKPVFGIAQSLFTHLSADDVTSCLSKLSSVAAPGCRLFATFFEVSKPVANSAVSHSRGYFAYTRSQMEDFGAQAGWKSHYIGEWNHPRDQKMVEYIIS